MWFILIVIPIILLWYWYFIIHSLFWWMINILLSLLLFWCFSRWLSENSLNGAIPSELDGNSTHPSSPHDAGTCATRSWTLWRPHSSIMLGFQLTCQAGYRSVSKLVLPDPLLTQGSPVAFLAYALHKLFVRSCDLAHHGPCCSYVCACTHHSSSQHLPYSVRLYCPTVPIWMNFRTCGCLLAPQGGITLTTRAFRSQHCILFNSYKLVRPLRLLCRYWLPHGSHMVQRLQALCPAHRLHTVPSVHRSRRAPPALSQVTLSQPRTLAEAATQLSFAAFLKRCISVSASPPPQLPSPRHLWMPPRRLFHTPLSPRIFLCNSRSRSSWLHLLCPMFSSPRVPDPSLRYFLTRLCRRLCTASHLTMPPHRTTAHGVLRRVYLLQWPFRPPSLAIGTLQCW